jgi:uncharacterized membrane protein
MRAQAIKRKAMFSKLLTKFNSFGNHHQIFLALIVGFILVCISWAIEKTMEEYVFHSKSLVNYLSTIVFGLLILWIIKHLILHVW